MRLKLSAAVIGIGLLTVMFLVAGCDNPAGSDDSAGQSLKGTLYQLQGIVIDSVTGQPVVGATVELDSSRSAVTDAGGAWLIKDVIPNPIPASGATPPVYHLSIWKDGYEVDTSAVVPALDVHKYLDDDPFYEKVTRNELLKAFNVWVSTEIGSSMTGATSDAGDGGNFTYTGGGTFIDGEGNSITYNNATKQFDWNAVDKLKIDYTYSYSVGIAVTKLNPLIGGLTGRINVVFAEQSDDTHAETAAIKDDVEVWVQTGTDPNYKKYGPVLTKDGVFTIDKLPATATAKVYTNGFYQKDAAGVEHFFDGVSSGAFRIEDFTSSTTGGTGTGGTGGTGTVSTAEAKGSPIGGAPGTLVTRINDIYVFKAPNIAFVASANVGESKKTTPLAVTDSITLTFTKDIDPGTFNAWLETTDTNNTPAAYNSATDYALEATWDAVEAKKVTLTVKVNATDAGYTYPHLPYSTASSVKAGDLVFTGKAKDGSTIAKNNLPVYTEPKVTLLNTEVLTSNIPPRALFVSTGNAVKFTFSKPILDSPALGFYEYKTSAGGNTKKLFHKVDSSVVYVYIDGPFAADTDSLAYENIVAADDPDDILGTAGSGNTGTNSLVSIVSKIKLSLRSTNLYTTRDSYDSPTAKPSGTDMTFFDKDSNIILTFNESIPENAKVYAKLQDAASTLTVVPVELLSSSQDTIIINPLIPLAIGTTYNLGVKVVLDNVTIFSTDDGSTVYIPATVAALAPIGTPPTMYIQFSTKLLSLRSTNLSATFDKDSSIILTFDESIPATANIQVQLRDTVTQNDVSYLVLIPQQNQDTVTIVPDIPLAANTAYKLSVKVEDNRKTIFSTKGSDYSTPITDLTVYIPATVADITTEPGFIRFKTRP